LTTKYVIRLQCNHMTPTYCACHCMQCGNRLLWERLAVSAHGTGTTFATIMAVDKLVPATRRRCRSSSEPQRAHHTVKGPAAPQQKRGEVPAPEGAACAHGVTGDRGPNPPSERRRKSPRLWAVLRRMALAASLRDDSDARLDPPGRGIRVRCWPIRVSGASSGGARTRRPARGGVRRRTLRRAPAGRGGHPRRSAW
jgi:hypothetical protein